VNHSLSLIALHCFPHLLSSNHKCAHPCLPLFRGEHQRWGRVLEWLRGVLRHADSPVIMPVEAEDEATSLLVIVCVWTFESTRLSVIREYCISLTLVRFITAMVLHSFIYHVCVNWSWRTREMHSVFLVKSGVTLAEQQSEMNIVPRCLLVKVELLKRWWEWIISGFTWNNMCWYCPSRSSFPHDFRVAAHKQFHSQFPRPDRRWNLIFL
jgi:hypothetical protein